jgi:iron(III) transport system substrate-binding protein
MMTMRHTRPPVRMNRNRTRGWAALLVLALFIAMGLTACGSGSSNESTTDSLADQTGPEGDAAWQQLVKDAKAEGEVVYYTSHGEDTMTKLAAAFEEEYGIKVTIFRAPDNDLEPKLDAEEKTGNHVADIVALSDLAYVKKLSQNGQLAEPTGPALDADGFDRKANSPVPDAIRSAGTTMSYAWNTDLHPDGLKDFSDLTDPSLSGGKVGILSPIAPAVMDFYHYLQEQYGDDYLDKLAEQKPRVYNAGSAMAEALASGEIAAATQVSQVVLYAAQDAGAPVDGGLADPAWAASFYEGVLAGAEHPAAAQLLMNYIFTPAGQEVIAERIASVLPDIPSAVTTVDKTTTGGDENATSEEFEDFVTEFNETFH